MDRTRSAGDRGGQYPAPTFACGAGGQVGNRAGDAPALVDSEVLDSLVLALPNEAAPFVGKSAVVQARQRIGEAPMDWLFERTARAWTTQNSPHHAYKGLRIATTTQFGQQRLVDASRDAGALPLDQPSPASRA